MAIEDIFTVLSEHFSKECNVRMVAPVYQSVSKVAIPTSPERRSKCVNTDPKVTRLELLPLTVVIVNATYNDSLIHRARHFEFKVSKKIRLHLCSWLIIFRDVEAPLPLGYGVMPYVCYRSRGEELSACP